METHHALVYIANSLASSAVPECYKTQSVDIHHVTVDRFGISDARTLAGQAAQTAVGKNGRIFVVTTNTIPVDAQNALLKLFEEPPKGVQFHIVIPQEGILIPTLRSRVQLMQAATEEISENEVFQTFLRSSYADRLSYVADITKVKDTQAIQELMHGAEMYAHTLVQSDPTAAKSVLLVSEYIKTPGASKKMLLEEVALSLPVT